MGFFQGLPHYALAVGGGTLRSWTTTDRLSRLSHTCTTTIGSTFTNADVRMRSEQFERLRRRAERDHAAVGSAGSTSKYDPTKPWAQCGKVGTCTHRHPPLYLAPSRQLRMLKTQVHRPCFEWRPMSSRHVPEPGAPDFRLPSVGADRSTLGQALCWKVDLSSMEARFDVFGRKDLEDGCRKDCTILVGLAKRNARDAEKMKAQRSTSCTTVHPGGRLENRSRRDGRNENKVHKHCNVSLRRKQLDE